MLPVLIALGPFKIYSFGVLFLVAFFLALFVIYKRGKESHFNEEDLINLSLVGGFWGIVIGRVVYGLLAATKPGVSFPSVFWQNGVDMVAALVTMGLVFWRRAKELKADYWQLTDTMVLGLSLFRAIMALADFFSGSRLGNPTTWFWGLTFPQMFDSRIPTQLLEFSLLIGLYFLIWRLEYSYRTFDWYKGNKSNAKEGFLTGIYLMGEGLVILLLYPLRPSGAQIFGWSLDAVYGFFGLVAGMVIISKRSGWGIKGIWQYWSKEIGLTGSLSDSIKRTKPGSTSLKLGRDLFD